MNSSQSLALRRKAEQRLGQVAMRAVNRIAHALPDRFVSGAGRRLGDLVFRFSKRYRGVALRNLGRFYGAELGPEGVERMARECFRHFGKNLMEFFRLPCMSDDELSAKVRLEGKEHLDAALARGKGVLLITAHFGNWELLAARMVQDGYRLCVIARDADDAGTSEMINRVRKNRGYRVFPRDGSMLPVVRALKDNQVLGILPDQHDIDGIFSDFMGRAALTPTGPAALALMTGALLVPGFAVRQPDDSFVARFYPAMEAVKTGDKERDLREWTARITQAIEVQVRENPTQWFWLHDRWKTPPPGEASRESAVAGRR